MAHEFTAQFVKLESGEWGVRVTGTTADLTYQEVLVTKRDGTTKHTKLAERITDDGANGQLYRARLNRYADKPADEPTHLKRHTFGVVQGGFRDEYKTVAVHYDKKEHARVYCCDRCNAPVVWRKRNDQWVMLKVFTKTTGSGKYKHVWFKFGSALHTCTGTSN